jgi:hypothetical protein
VYDNISGTYNWNNSDITMNMLTINNIVNILKTHKTDDFTNGIKYTIVEDIELYDINSINVNGTELEIEIDNNVFKDGEWIFLDNSPYTYNLQIIRKIGNNIVVVRPNAILSIPSLSVVKARKEKSIMPFMLKPIDADNIKIDNKFNIVLGDDSSPIIALNNTRVINNLVITPNREGIIENVYHNNSIIRRLKRVENNVELTYKELKKLKSIKRWSGQYEPIILNVELFNVVKLRHLNTAIVKQLHIDNTTYKISLVYDMTTINGFKINVGDIIYIENNSFQFLSNKTTQVSKVTISGSLLIAEIFDDFDVAPILSNIDFTGNVAQEFKIYIHDVQDKNIYFDTNYQNFGTVKNVIAAKVYDTTNPMRSNNSLNDTGNKFPMIDEHGVMNVNKNIFMSPWDLNYYKLLAINKYTTL